MAVGKDGKIYITDPGTSSIGVLNPFPVGFNTVEFPTPTPGADPTSIAVANDGTIWFTETGVGQVGEFDPTTHKITEFPVGVFGSSPNDIQLGPDGKLWFSENAGFASIDPTTHAIATINAPAGQQRAGGFSFTPAGDIQYIAVINPVVGGGGQYAAAQLDPATSTFTVAPPSATFAKGGPFPQQLATGADGNVYFASTPIGPGTVVGEVNVATQTLSSHSGGTQPAIEHSIVAGSDGNLYVGGYGVIGKATIVPPDVSAISGQVTVGSSFITTTTPIANRTVFVDVNGDGIFDAGDPFGVTDANGNYTITFVPTGVFNVRVVPFPGDFTTPVLVTTTAGQALQNVALTVQPSTAVLPLTLSATPFGAHNPDLATAEVRGLYKIILNRAPDPGGLAFYVNQLNVGASVAVVAQQMLHSAEYETDLVYSDYQNYFGRVASPAEVQGWVNLMQKGYTAEAVTTLMLDSDGFSAMHPDNASFIQALYGDLLGRQANAAEVAGWSSYLATSNRGVLVSLIVHSPEAYARAAQGFYAEFWASPSDPVGVANVVKSLQSGLTLADMASLFANSPPYIARAQATVG